MKRFLFAALSVALVCLSVSAGAQERIALTGAADGSTCSVVDNEPGIVEIYIVVFDVVGLAALQFAAPKPNCWSGATWLSDNMSSEVVIGGTQDPVGGMAIAWGYLAPCTQDGGGGLDGPVYVGSMMFSTAGQGMPCCRYPVVKAQFDLHPEIDGPIVVLCSDQQEVVGIGADAVINPDSNCPCANPVPVEETTWGAVKALYQ